MSANEIENFVIVFPDVSWLQDPSDFNPERISPNMSYAQDIYENLQTLSTNDADPSGLIQGLLYVPDLNPDDPCYKLALDYVPKNVTHQVNLPATDFNLIAVAPWINVNCTLSYLASTAYDPIRAFIFYLPNNSTSQPPPVTDPVWDLGDGGQWRTTSHYPVYAVPGAIGEHMIRELGRYSGNVTSVPFGKQLLQLDIDPRDYVRIYTAISISNTSSLPGLWVFLLIIIGVLAAILCITSLLMHYIQRRSRESLRRRVMTGDVDLEALGIKRLHVPADVIVEMPLFIYTCGVRDPPVGSPAAVNMSFTGYMKYKDSRKSVTESFRSESSTSSIVAHDYAPQSQPTCPICLEDFESGSSVVRELPCHHIFHPECIDTFLNENSSLCPMCKKSALPLGHCPVVITNSMVRRERAIRRLRSRVTITEESSDLEIDTDYSRSVGWRNRSRRMLGGGTIRDRDGTDVRLQPSSRSRHEGPVFNILGRPERLSRQDMARQRAQHLPEISDIEEHEHIGDNTSPKWRRAVAKAFPGFK